jgi:hypothetical protein
MAGKAHIPAHVIAARGVKITLLDGSTPSLVYGFSSIMRLEEDFGSIEAALNSVSSEGGAAALTAIAKVLCAGLEHESANIVDGQGATVASGPLSEIGVLRYLLDSTQIEEYSDAIGQAFENGFPSRTKEGDEDPTKGAESSPGQTGTTSAPSSSDAQTPSSGA